MFTKNDDGFLVETVEQQPKVTIYSLKQLNAQIAYYENLLVEIQTLLDESKAKKRAATDLGIQEIENDVLPE